MSYYCPHCGAELTEGTNFCSACGKKVEQQQTSAEISQPRKSKKKLIIGILAIIIAVVIVIIIILFLLGGTSSFNGADSRFVGEWEQDLGLGGKLLWKFNSDSTLATGSSGGAMYNVGTWNVKGSQLCLYNNAVCYTYELSSNGNTLTLNIFGDSFSYPMNVVLTKKGQGGTKTQTPNVACTADSTTNRITVVTVDSNIKWKDIVLSNDTFIPSVNWTIYYNAGTTANAINTQITATNIDVLAGDYILLNWGTKTGNVKITLRYTPTNSLLGTWTVNV